MEYLKAGLWEIKKSGSLRTLGGLLALFHCLQFYLWLDQGRLPLKFVQQGVPMCWPVIENCDWLRLISPSVLTAIFFAYAVFAALAALIFLATEFVGVAYWLFFISGLMGFILYFQDYRLSSNEGYFLLLLTFAFLFIPSKHRLMRWLIVSFIAARGLSQASPDWLSGAWYMEQMSLPVKLAEWLAAVSVLVQMIGGAALLFRDGRYFWTGWFSIFGLACANLFLGQVFGGSITLGALLYIALDEFELRKAEREYLYQSFIRPEPSFVLGGAFLFFFWMAQLTPFIVMERDSPLRTTMMIWTLHPEAAHEECEQRTFATYKRRIEEITVVPQMNRQPAMQCNPYLRFLDLKAHCDLLKKDEDFVTLSSVLMVQNFRERLSYRAFEVKDFCDPELTFKRVSEVRWTTNLAQ